MAGYQTPAVTATMNASGTVSGNISVPDNSRFLVGAEAWLNHAGTITNVIIADLTGTNLIGCKLKPGSINPFTGVPSSAAGYVSYGRTDLSSYVSGDTITMPAQFVVDAVAPSIPATALVADSTSGVGALNDTGIIDVSNYSSLAIMVTLSGGTEAAFTMYWADDAGTLIQAGAIATPTANTQKSWGLGAANGINGPVPRRVRFTSALVAAQTTRILVYGRK
jgi:hypothetical protein